MVESDYFGTVPADRLKVGDGMIRFRVDGHFRSKIEREKRACFSDHLTAAVETVTLVGVSPAPLAVSVESPAMW